MSPVFFCLPVRGGFSAAPNATWFHLRDAEWNTYFKNSPRDVGLQEVFKSIRICRPDSYAGVCREWHSPCGSNASKALRTALAFCNKTYPLVQSRSRLPRGECLGRKKGYRRFGHQCIRATRIRLSEGQHDCPDGARMPTKGGETNEQKNCIEPCGVSRSSGPSAGSDGRPDRRADRPDFRWRRRVGPSSQKLGRGAIRRNLAGAGRSERYTVVELKQSG